MIDNEALYGERCEWACGEEEDLWVSDVHNLIRVACEVAELGAELVNVCKLCRHPRVSAVFSFQKLRCTMVIVPVVES